MRLWHTSLTKGRQRLPHSHVAEILSFSLQFICSDSVVWRSGVTVTIATFAPNNNEDVNNEPSLWEEGRNLWITLLISKSCSFTPARLGRQVYFSRIQSNLDNFSSIFFTCALKTGRSIVLGLLLIDKKENRSCVHSIFSGHLAWTSHIQDFISAVWLLFHVRKRISCETEMIVCQTKGAKNRRNNSNAMRSYSKKNFTINIFTLFTV